MKAAGLLLALFAAGPAQAAGALAAVHWNVPGDPATAWSLNRMVRDAAMPPPNATRYETLVVAWPAGATLQLAGGPELAPTPLPGFGNFYNDARAVTVSAGGQATLTDDEGTPSTVTRIPAGTWIGLRGRFHAVLLRADVPLSVEAREAAPERPIVRLAAAGGQDVTIAFFAGPVEPAAFPAEAPELANMLHAGIWKPLRWLAGGLRALLDFWHSLVGQWGLAILLLSASVRLLMAPLIYFAERWQAEVNRIRSRLQPELDAIRREHRGEEAHKRTLAVYRGHGVTPFYAVKSLAGFLIQVPVFIAAFDMLGEHWHLEGTGFLWIPDLALPERLATLPFALPFLGAELNLLPLLMTALTVAAARLQEDESLIPALRRHQRLRLYAMAGAFLVLLYTFPAGMVLYWTANNLWHLLRVLAGRLGR